MKKYLKPEMLAMKMEMNCELLANSLNSGAPTSGDIDNLPTMGGESGGTHDVGSKALSGDLWDFDE
jgi:hypothetical protein